MRTTVTAAYDGYEWTVSINGWTKSGFASTLWGACRRAQRAGMKLADLPPFPADRLDALEAQVRATHEGIYGKLAGPPPAPGDTDRLDALEAQVRATHEWVAALRDRLNSERG